MMKRCTSDSESEEETSCFGRNSTSKAVNVEEKPKIPKLEEVFEQHYNEKVCIKDVNLTYKDPTQIYKEGIFHSSVHIEGTLKCRLKSSEEWQDINLFVKLSPTSYIPMNIVIKMDMNERFMKERNAYKKIIPILEQFQRDDYCAIIKRIETYLFITPKFYGSRLSLRKELDDVADQDGLIALENLKPAYSEIDPEIGLSLEEIKVVVKKLAIFHAVPLAYKAKYPLAYMRIVYPGLQVPFNERQSCCVPSEVNYVLGRVAKIRDLSEHEELIKLAVEYSQNKMAVPPRKETWIGMCHGKFFCYNVMVRTDPESGLPDDCRIVDFQHLMKRHILTDLAFLLMTSAAKGVLINHYYEITKAYHERFVEEVAKLGADPGPFSYVEFMNELKLSFRKDLLRGLQALKFVSAKKAYKNFLRTLSTWPKYKERNLEEKINRYVYMEKLKELFQAMVHLDLLSNIPHIPTETSV